MSSNFRGNLFRLCETGGGSGALDPPNPIESKEINKKARGEHRVPFSIPDFYLLKRIAISQLRFLCFSPLSARRMS